MWIIQEPKKVALWSKRHFEEENGECAACLKYSVLIVVEKKYIKCNIWRVAVRLSYIWDARFLKVNVNEHSFSILSERWRSVGLSRSVYAHLVFKVPTPIFRSSLPSAPYHIHLYWFISVVLRLQPSLSILWTLLSFSMFYIVRPDRLNTHSLSCC